MKMAGKFVPHDVGFGSLNVIPHHVTIMGKCEACGSMREMDRRELEQKAGSGAWLADAEARLKCVACGAKSGKILTGYYVTESGDLR